MVWYGMVWYGMVHSSMREVLCAMCSPPVHTVVVLVLSKYYVSTELVLTTSPCGSCVLVVEASLAPCTDHTVSE